MRRRQIIGGLLGGVAVAAWPRVAHAQQSDGTRRIGVLMGYVESDPEARSRLAAFTHGLQVLQWSEGRNLRIDTRWAAGDLNRMPALARELVTLQPEVILSNTTPVTAALHRETRTIPIVFVVVSDPVGSGFVENLARPGGNVTGFINLESSMVEKWLELLKEIAPSVTRVAVMFNPQTAPYAEFYLRPLEAAAPSIGVKPFTAPVQSEADIEGLITGLGRELGVGLIVMTDSYMFIHRKPIISLAARNRVPTIYFSGHLSAEGGLIAYGPDTNDLFRRAAAYVDRILRGANPADLPVQQPTKFELVINLKTAQALGLELPPSLLARADEVIE
jgi:putative ABC transport system substrate-binding protein